MMTHRTLPAFVVGAILLATSGCARQEIMARPSESKITGAPIPAPLPAPSPGLLIATEIRSQCHLHEMEGAADAPKMDFDASLLASAEIGTLEQIATCFTTGPMKGRILTLRGRARANAAQDALVSFGVPRASITSEPGGQTDREIDIDAVR